MLATAVPLDQFPDTQWTWIRRASSAERGAALGVLCQAYWYPVYCFLRRCGASPSDAGDVTQDFFEHLMQTNAFSSVEPRQDARFRSWLRTSAKRYFLNWVRNARTDTKGGQAHHVPIDGVGAEQRLEGELMHLLTPDRLFDRCWARTVTERARQRLHARYSSTADIELMNEAVAELSGCAAPRVRAPDSSRTPVPGSERTRKSRRKGELLDEYKKCLRREIHGTVGSPDLIDHEIRLLLDVLPCRETT
jgi:RNA polymerase sigma factor (sigma-70 family)